MHIVLMIDHGRKAQHLSGLHLLLRGFGYPIRVGGAATAHNSVGGQK